MTAVRLLNARPSRWHDLRDAVMAEALEGQERRERPRRSGRPGAEERGAAVAKALEPGGELWREPLGREERWQFRFEWDPLYAPGDEQGAWRQLQAEAEAVLERERMEEEQEEDESAVDSEDTPVAWGLPMTRRLSRQRAVVAYACLSILGLLGNALAALVAAGVFGEWMYGLSLLGLLALNSSDVVCLLVAGLFPYEGVLAFALFAAVVMARRMAEDVAWFAVSRDNSKRILAWAGQQLAWMGNWLPKRAKLELGRGARRRDASAGESVWMLGLIALWPSMPVDALAGASKVPMRRFVSVRASATAVRLGAIWAAAHSTYGDQIVGFATGSDLVAFAALFVAMYFINQLVTMLSGK